MNLPAFCIKRPAFTIVITLVMTIIGILGFINLPVRWIPNVNPPQISIMTNYSGANARLVEQDVTRVIESALSGINGIETLTSTSKEGESIISITFRLGRNMDSAIEDVRSSIERVRGGLPKDVSNPNVIKADTNNMPILYISFSDSRRNQRELSDYIDKYVMPSLETTDGVGSILVYGKQISAMHVWLDPAKMAGANVTVDEVAQLIHDQNSSVPSGQIRGADRIFSIVTDTTLKTPEQFNDLIIRDRDNQVVRLRDIGEAKIDAENSDGMFRISGKPAVALGVFPQSTANPLIVEKNIQNKLTEVRRSLPTGMRADIVYNQADFIRASIRSVYDSFFEAVIFVWLVILAFLCSFRATLVPIITIPVCLISTFAVLYVFGFSINTITLMAFVLAIGLVVDDAIVMLENIRRHMEEGLPAFSAALKGSQEIIFPIIAMTLTLTAVYAPIAFTPGLLGLLFREFTFTLAGAVIISGIVALTLSPMMCARILKMSARSNPYSEWLGRQLNRVQEKYHQWLDWILKRRKWVLVSLILTAAIGGSVFLFIPSELAPVEDMNEIDVLISAPRSSSFLYTDSYVKQLESLYQTMPDIDSYFSAGGFSASHAYQELTLKPRGKRKQSTEEIVAALIAKANSFPGVKVMAFTPPPALAQFANTNEGRNIGLVVMTTSDYRKLQQATQRLVDIIKQDPDFATVDNKLKWDAEQFKLTIDRNRAADLKVAIPSVTNTLSVLLAGRNVGKIDDSNIIVQLNQSALANPNIFQQLYVRNTEGISVALSQILNVTETTTPEVFSRYERLRADTIRVSLAPTLKIGDAIKKLEKIAKTNLPDDMKYTFSGEAKSFLESNGKTLFTFVLALLFIYLVLVAQFESFIDPLIILFTVPFALVGALLTLKLFGGSLNIYSNIGLITLIGLIAKHGILITEFANRLRGNGKSIHEAVIESALLRLRPILMTTAAMILGALPLAFAFGPGAESRQQVGLVIAGGLLFGTFFSLVVVPVMYTYLAPWRKISLATPNQE